jgi:hypothetical protein
LRTKPLWVRRGICRWRRGGGRRRKAVGAPRTRPGQRWLAAWAGPHFAAGRTCLAARIPFSSFLSSPGSRHEVCWGGLIITAALGGLMLSGPAGGMNRGLGGNWRFFVLLCILQVGSGMSASNSELPALSHRSRRCPPAPLGGGGELAGARSRMRGGQLSHERSTMREIELGSSFSVVLPLRVLAMGRE